MRLRQHNPEAYTRDAIKLTARRLFATRGIDGVSVREIVVAAGQRNGGSLHYHFGTKEALVRELIVDGAKLIDERRKSLLDAVESRSRPATLREIVEILVWPATNLGDASGGEETYIRFITMLQMSHRHMFLDALENHWNSGYLRCLSHIRQLLPKVPAVILNQRLIFMGIYLPAVIAARESALDAQHGTHPFWSAAYTMENLVDSIERLLDGPISAQTRRKASASLRQPAAKNLRSAGK
ncbi:MAG: TetR/AcrR family transcriptional regulator [Pseudomonadota bacterium]|nr:TetR/AcrR family transcriptional regulator [Pseudomonadota bacterium]